MLPKKFRLKNKKDFDRVHQQGKFYRDQFAALKIVSNKMADTRIGIIVGLKISKKAVIRNKVKRRIRASILEVIDQIKPGFDVVILVRPEIVDKNYQEISVVIRNLLVSAGLLEKNG